MGKTVWFGQTEQAIKHFNELGYFLPLNTNPSDFFMDIITFDQRTPELREKSTNRINMFAEAWNTKAVKFPDTPMSSQVIYEKDEIKWSLPWYMEFFVLLSRNMKDVYRDKASIGAKLGQGIFLMLFMGFIFSKLPFDAAGIQSRTGL